MRGITMKITNLLSRKSTKNNEEEIKSPLPSTKSFLNALQNPLKRQILLK